MPLGVVGALVGLTVEDALGGSKAQTGNLNASLQRTYLGVHTDVTYQYNFIYHISYLVLNVVNVLLYLVALLLLLMLDIGNKVANEVAVGAIDKVNVDRLVVHSAA